MDKLTIAIIQQALKKLFKQDGYFSICVFDEICKVGNFIPRPGVRDKLSLIHCVHYRDMSKEVLEGISEMVMETFENPGFDFELFQDDNKVVHLKNRSGLQRLLGKK